MKFINDIKEETLIICNNTVKEKILKRNKLLPIKLMDMATFMHHYLFSYNESAILYLIGKYQMKYDVAKNYLEQIYYIEDKNYKNQKLDYLVSLKKELDDNELLIYNPKFKEYLKRVKIILYDQEVDNYTQRILEGLNYQIIEREYQEYKHEVHEFETMEEEVHYVAHQISELLEAGIPISKIKLTNITKDYYNALERIFNLYNLKVDITYKTPLINYQLVKDFLSHYQELTLEESLKKEAVESVVYNKLVNVINKYIKYQSKELIVYKIKNSYIENTKYNNSIEIIDYLEYLPEEDEHIFMLNFNDGIVPRQQMDTNYITDNIATKIGLYKTKEINKKVYDKTIKCMNNIKNLIITYKLHDNKGNYYPSELQKNYQKINDKVDIKTTYSELYDKIKLTKCYDEYYKYGVKTEDFTILRNNYGIKYNSFNNKYNTITRVMDKLNLSYSKMQIYNKCAFRYYLTDILKLDIFEENFSTIIGSMVHYVLEKCLKDNNNEIDAYVSEFLAGHIFTKKEEFFLKKYKEAIKELLAEINLEKEYSLFNQALYEKKIDIDFGNNVHFIGIIDKILYYIDNDTTYVALVDYKTGMDEINLKYLKYGINIQLPIYLYLSTQLPFNNIKYSGIYLQKFNITNKDYRLTGYSNANHRTLSVIDSNYANSKIIKSLKLNNDGSFSKNSKVLSDNEFDKIKEEVANQINKVINNIKNNRFDINPKVIEGKNIGCEYCKFKDICFVTKDDELEIETAGGDI